MNHAAREVVVLPPNEELLVWDPASSVLTLIGSLLSLAATSTVILLWTFAGGKNKKDFRYALILNLTVAEFLNSLNNSISGLAVNVLRRPLFPSTACSFNGWAGQFSVQAVDFSILAISIITLLTIQLRSYIIYASTLTKTLVCLSVWIIPLCTSLYAWRKDYLGPVSGNWCWIQSSYTRQRYILTHGWRFCILAITLCSYIFVFIYMSRRLKPQDLSTLTVTSSDDKSNDEDPIEMRRAPHRRDNAVLSGCSTPPASSHNLEPPAPHGAREHRRNSSSLSLAMRLSLRLSPSIHRQSDRSSWGVQPSVPPSPPSIAPALPSSESTRPILFDVDLEKPLPQPPLEITSLPVAHPAPPDLEKQAITTTVRSSTRQTTTTTTNPPNKAKIDREIWRMILLNMYPVTYFILWMPGIANRIAEGLGHSIQALIIMQSSTQYIGLANACVYFYKEHGRDIKLLWDKITCTRYGSTPASVVLDEEAANDRRWTEITI